jgi:hypothetical protein
MLARAKMALGDLHSPDSGRAITAVYLIAVFGRATTQTLQTLRTYRRDRFNAWWEPRQAFMSSDPLLIFFNHLRNAFLKEGGRDHSGGSLIGFGGGTKKKWRCTWYFLGSPKPPTEQDGKPIFQEKPEDGPTVETLGRLYIDFLERLVNEAVDEFKWRPIPPPWNLPGPKPRLPGE